MRFSSHHPLRLSANRLPAWRGFRVPGDARMVMVAHPRLLAFEPPRGNEAFCKLNERVNYILQWHGGCSTSRHRLCCEDNRETDSTWDSYSKLFSKPRLVEFHQRLNAFCLLRNNPSIKNVNWRLGFVLPHAVGVPPPCRC